MNPDRDVFKLAWHAGQAIWIHAEGRPAVILAGAAVLVGAVIAYGSFTCGHKLKNLFGSD